jgi:hypothetical protein
MSDIQLRCDKRAYIAYLGELTRKEKENKELLIEGKISIDVEIRFVEAHLRDIDFLINNPKE